MKQPTLPGQVKSEDGAVRTSTIFLLIIVVIAAASIGLIAWQIYYAGKHPHEVAKRNEQIQEQLHRSDSDKDNQNKQDGAAQDQSLVDKTKIDNSVAKYFENICADPNQGVDHEMCSNSNSQLRYDVAWLVAAIEQAKKSDGHLLTTNTALLANKKSDNKIINSFTSKMSNNIRTATVVDVTTEAMVSNMNFGDVLIIKNSECTPDHFGSIASDRGTTTALSRFYNTPMYFCQEIK